MTKWIRWGGFIAFVVIAAALSAFFLLLAAPLTKGAIEKYGTQANGALVEVADVSISFSPFGLKIEGLQVADAKKPMQNSMQFDRSLLALELAPLFLGKVIISDMSVDGLRFGTARTTSGAVQIVKEEKAESNEPSLLDNVELPSADEILARETFTTEVAGDAFRAAYEQNKAILDERLAAVPDDKALKAYEVEIKALTSGRLKSVEDFQERKKKLDAIKKRFEADQEAIQAARKAIVVAQDEVGGRLKELKNAPANDLKNLKEKYRLDAAGATNLSALLFGNEAGEWAAQTLYWYEKVKPYLEKDEAEAAAEEPVIPRGGRYIAFPTPDPWPKALLREARLTAHLAAGDLLIDIRDVTSSQKELGRPTLLVANGSNLKSVDDLTVEAIFDHRTRPGKDSLSLTVKDWQLDAMKLGIAGAQLKSANVQVQAYALVSSNTLSANGQADFLQTNFTADSKTVFEKELGNALGTIKQFNVGAKANGKLQAPTVVINSNLDNQLGAALNQRLKERQREIEDKIERELQAKLRDKLGKYGDDYAQLATLDGSLDNKLKQVRSMASTQLEDFAAQEKREAKEKLDREKAEAEAKAKAEKKEAEAKAKEKLKKLF